MTRLSEWLPLITGMASVAVGAASVIMAIPKDPAAWPLIAVGAMLAAATPVLVVWGARRERDGRGRRPSLPPASGRG